METLAAALSPARERVLLGLHPSLQHSGMNHKEMPPQGTNWSLFERADGSWTSAGMAVEAGGRLHPAPCVHGSAAATRQRGRACFAALPAEKPFPCVFGSLISLNKQFLCTEEEKKYAQPLVCCKAFFLGSGECGDFHLLAAPLVLCRGFGAFLF